MRRSQFGTDMRIPPEERANGRAERYHPPYPSPCGLVNGLPGEVFPATSAHRRLAAARLPSRLHRSSFWTLQSASYPLLPREALSGRLMTGPAEGGSSQGQGVGEGRDGQAVCVSARNATH